MFDARNSSGGRTNLILSGFGLFGVMGIVFLLVLFWPTSTDHDEAYRAQLADSTQSVISRALPDLATELFEASLMTFDMSAYTSTSEALRKSQTQAEARKLIIDQIGFGLNHNRQRLAYADEEVLQALLQLTDTRLLAALKDRHPGCSGTNYLPIVTKTEAMQVAQMSAEKLLRATPDATQYMLDASTLIIASASNASPMSQLPSSLTGQDYAMLEGVSAHLQGDKNLGPLLLTLQKNEDISGPLAQTNLCEAALLLTSTVRTLPEATKARLWASLITGDMNWQALGLF